METQAPQFTLVVPLYKSEACIPSLLNAVDSLSADSGGRLQAVFVDDGSPDGGYGVLRAGLTGRAWAWKIVRHARNFGAFEAIRTGLAHADGNFIAVMAADLQEPPEVVQNFFQVLAAGRAQVVVGRRIARQDPFLTRLSSSAFWWLYRRFVNSAVPAGGVDVFGCTKQVAAMLTSLRETHSSLLGQLFWVGFQREFVDYSRQARAQGTSAWTLAKKLTYMADSVFAFTDLPLRLLTGVGCLGLLGCFVVGMITLLGRLAGWIHEPGYTPLILAMATSTASILLGLGIVGSYVWRTFENTKGRPVSIVAMVESGPPS
jgi:glycosyltransferase involved in cell wall biosynthesis